MIFGKISDSARIEALHPALQRLFEFVKTHDLMQLPLGRNEIDGDRLYINIAENNLVAPEAQKLEVHRAYMDVHPGEYLIAYPEDAHAPLIGSGSLRKAVAKIKL